MKKRTFDADSLEDYDVERIADKIEDTGRIATAVHSEVSEQLHGFTQQLDFYIERVVKKHLRKANLKTNEDAIKAEVMLKLIRHLLEEEE